MDRPLRRAWGIREWALLALLLAVAVSAHRAALLDMLLFGFKSEEQSHILLVPFVAGWLFWLTALQTIRTGQWQMSSIFLSAMAEALENRDALPICLRKKGCQALRNPTIRSSKMEANL